MANFAYMVRDSAGAAQTGVLSADSPEQAAALLRGEGKYPVWVRPANTAADSRAPRRGYKISRAEVITIATQLSVMVETGVTLSEALSCIAQQTEKPTARKLVEDLSTQVQTGSDFSSALARHPRSFPRVFIALIRASEKSGMLSRMLLRGTQYLRDEQETVRRVRGALTYPGIMLGFAVTTTIFLLAFVLPRFTAIYAAKSAMLPAPTRILLAISGFVTGHWLALILGIAAGAAGLMFYGRTTAGQRLWHQLQLRVPLIGPMLRKMHLARSLRMIGTMSGAGVTLTECVETARGLCGNTCFTDLWTTVAEKIQVGRQLSEPLFESPLVPRSVAQMIFSGEKSGKLSAVLEQVATHSEQELKERIADLTRYIEPAMIVLMGGIIGGVAMALLLPIFTISRVMGGH